MATVKAEEEIVESARVSAGENENEKESKKTEKAK